MKQKVLWAAIGAVSVAALVVWSVTAGRKAPPPPALTLPASRLPILGTVGDLPPEGGRLIIEADAAGRATADGRLLDPDSLRELLQQRADAAREEEGPRAAKLNVVFRLDRDFPWLQTQWLMMACIDPKIRIYRIFFAALPEDGGEEGAIATFLPGGPSPDYYQTAPVGSLPVHVPVQILPDESSLTVLRRDLPSFLASSWAGLGYGPARIQISLDAGPSVPTGAVLQAVETAFRSGVNSVVFRSPPSHRHDPVARVSAGIPWNGRGFSVRVLDSRMPPAALPSSLLPPSGRLRGRLTGQTTSPPEAAPIFPDRLEPDSFSDGEPAVAPLPPGVFSSRRARQAALRAEGGDGLPDNADGTESSVEASLEWLKKHQSQSGFWDCEGFDVECKINKCGGAGKRAYTPGVSGLAVLAFLGHGETHKTPLYGSAVRSALKYLKGIQDSEGCFGSRTRLDDEPRGHLEEDHFTYNHAIATLAMAEAYGMTYSPLFKASAQNGVNFILQCQNPYLGWRYGVRPQGNDTSVTAWMVLALNAARGVGLHASPIAAIQLDPASFDGAKAWLDRVTDPETGRVGYTRIGDGPKRPEELIDRFPADESEATTAMAVLTRILCGVASDDSVVLKGADLCVKKPPRWSASSEATDYCYWFFGSEALFQVGGARWKAWNEAMKGAVMGSQRLDRADDRYGSWDPLDPWATEGGRVYATAMNSLCLETYYRYPRLAKPK